MNDDVDIKGVNDNDLEYYLGAVNIQLKKLQTEKDRRIAAKSHDAVCNAVMIEGWQTYAEYPHGVNYSHVKFDLSLTQCDFFYRWRHGLLEFLIISNGAKSFPMQLPFRIEQKIQIEK
jgi:hypothetical protein